MLEPFALFPPLKNGLSVLKCHQVIHGPSNYAYDIDLGPVTLNDYYHKEYYTILEGVVGTDLADESVFRPASDNNLINGKMDFACGNSTGNITTGTCVNNAGLSKFDFTSGKKHRLRLMNTGIAAIQKFSIDNHTMTVIANDFIPIEPYEATIITLGVSTYVYYLHLHARHSKRLHLIGRATHRCRSRSNRRPHRHRLDALRNHVRRLH